ncbi:MAG: hypothetical protein JSS65_02885 [Armatimonadetes bacterium]|nr:hypothetical protein [Armatimonadota bacterium]
MRVLTTGYGPFLSVTENPSGWLVERCGAPCVVLPVSFAAVDKFLAELDPDTFDALVMVGVHGRARKMRLESVARNVVGKTPDVEGQVLGPGKIDPTEPDRIRTSLWSGVRLADFTVTDDAGDYLCNYIFYRASVALPEKKVGFVHVPPWDRMSQERQLAAIQRLLNELRIGSA